MELLILLVIVLVLGFLAKRLWDTLFRKVTIFEFERAVAYKNGKFHKVLEPGAYWIRPTLTTITTVDMRPRFITIPGQEVLSSDSVSLKVSLAAQFKVTDPQTAILKVENYYAALYTVLQIAAREVIGSTKIDELLQQRDNIGQKLRELSASRTAEFGIELMSVAIKDIMFTGEMKKVFAQVIKAQKEGQAALEKARGETAALRNLANAAKLVESNPALMQVRLLQSVGETSGNTLVLGMPSTSTPIPVKVKTSEPPHIQSEGTAPPDES